MPNFPLYSNFSDAMQSRIFYFIFAASLELKELRKQARQQDKLERQMSLSASQVY